MDDPQLAFAAGNQALELGRREEALAAFDRVIALAPGFAPAHAHRSGVLLDLGRPHEALAALDRAIALAPGVAGLHSNRGRLLHDLGRLDDALAAHDRALALEPGHPAWLWNKSLVVLAQGHLAKGFELYEHRKALGFGARHPGPAWIGEPVAGRTVLLHAEQGLGDTLQFARYAPLLAARGAKVVLAAPEALHPVLSRLTGVEVIAEDAPPPAYDNQSSLMSLPLAFRTTLQSIPAEPYLSADPRTAARWAERLGPKTRPRIALVWRGRPSHENDGQRSIPMEDLTALLDPCAQWLSLTKDSSGPLPPGVRDLSADLSDFGDTAAVIALSDLVITVDTSVAHLAGGMGKPVWILLPSNPDWRWLRGRADSPWYPSARLIRQTAWGDWAPVLAEARASLELLLA